MYELKNKPINRGSGLKHGENLIVTKMELLRELWGDGIKKGPHS